MSPLPHAADAILDIRKIEDYCLSPSHPRGRHKARVFRDALGLQQGDAYWLRQVLLDAVLDGEAIEIVGEQFGARYRVDVAVERHGKRAVVRTIWMLQSGQQVPRFVTCWVL